VSLGQCGESLGWESGPSQGKARQGKARQGKARQGKARQGKATQQQKKSITYDFHFVGWELNPKS